MKSLTDLGVKMKSSIVRVFYALVFGMGLYCYSATPVYARTVTYQLDNVFLTSSSQMTGTFEWTYNEGDFENGQGVFRKLTIPLTTHTLNDLEITFDINKTIEFTLNQNLNGDGVDITLVFKWPLTATASAPLDLDLSKYAIGSGGTNHPFIRGAVSPVVVPLPAAFWLSATGVFALVGVGRRT